MTKNHGVFSFLLSVRFKALYTLILIRGNGISIRIAIIVLKIIVNCAFVLIDVITLVQTVERKFFY